MSAPAAGETAQPEAQASQGSGSTARGLAGRHTSSRRMLRQDSSGRESVCGSVGHLVGCLGGCGLVPGASGAACSEVKASGRWPLLAHVGRSRGRVRSINGDIPGLRAASPRSAQYDRRKGGCARIAGGTASGRNDLRGAVHRREGEGLPLRSGLDDGPGDGRSAVPGGSRGRSALRSVGGRVPCRKRR